MTITIIITIVLPLLTAILPMNAALRMPVVESLNTKRTPSKLID